MFVDGTKKTTKPAQNPLFEKRSKTFGIGEFRARRMCRGVALISHVGGDIPPKRDLTRFVKWPEYVRLQRQKVILNQRLKVRSSHFHSVHNANARFRSHQQLPSSPTLLTKTPPLSSSPSSTSISPNPSRRRRLVLLPRPRHERRKATRLPRRTLRSLPTPNTVLTTLSPLSRPRRQSWSSLPMMLTQLS
jgi:hypothetical protein